MTARDLIHEIESLPQDERTKVESWLRANDSAREDALDLALLKERAHESGRDFRTVLAEFGIQPE